MFDGRFGIFVVFESSLRRMGFAYHKKVGSDENLDFREKVNNISGFFLKIFKTIIFDDNNFWIFFRDCENPF